MKTKIEQFKDAILEGENSTVKSMIYSNPSLMNIIDEKDKRPLICFFLKCYKTAPLEFLLFPLNLSQLDWTSESIHITLLELATERGTNLILGLDDKSSFLKGSETKTIIELAIENENKYKNQLDRALKMKDGPNKEKWVKNAQQKLDTSEEITNLLNEMTKKVSRENSQISANNENVDNHLNNFINLSKQHKEIKTDFLQKQTQVLIDGNKETLAIMKRVQPNFLNNSNISLEEKENFKNMVEELEKDIQTTLTM